MLLTADRPRSIDRYIDYFGGVPISTPMPVLDRADESRVAVLRAPSPVIEAA